MRILIATDSFPPTCGGSGWSTYELAQGLAERGHELIIVQVRAGRGADTTREYGGLRVREFAFVAPDIPYVRNYFKNERLYRRLAPMLRRMARAERIDLIHAQHVMTSPAAVWAGESSNVPVVCTIRDYWPVCYWSTLIYQEEAPTLCPGCSTSMMTTCVRPRAGRLWPLALPLIPYMRANLALKRQTLARADALIAVSARLARDLRERAPELERVPIATIPNPVNLSAIDSARSTGAPVAGPYALYVGKLASNKGVKLLAEVIRQARLAWPLVVVGEGPERAALEAAFKETGHDTRFTGWLPREEALTCIRHAAMLVFPSRGPESLSRVLLEASALGVPIAAMDTGGTSEIVEHEVTGLLSRSPEELATHVARLAADSPLRARLGAAARARIEQGFSLPVVIGRIEALYGDVVARRKNQPRRN